MTDKEISNTCYEIYSRADDLLRHNKAALVDKELKGFNWVREKNLVVREALTYLTVTLAAESLLQNREAFFCRMHSYLHETNEENIQSLLYGLKGRKYEHDDTAPNYD